LRNPLAAIKGLVQLLARKEREPHARERIRVVESEVGRMEAILRDYLSYSRPFEDLRAESVDLGSLAREIVATLSGRADAAGVSLHYRVEGAATVRADRLRLKEAFGNLVQNAIDACSDGGSVELVFTEHEGRIRAIISDDGHGIAPDALAHVGTPFFTTRENGTGLGVVVAKSVIAHHGGSLSYESSVGRGTRVKL